MNRQERKLGTWAGILSAICAILWFVTLNMISFKLFPIGKTCPPTLMPSGSADSP